MSYQITNLKTLAKSEIADGMRLCRIIAKGGKVDGKEIESQGVVIPCVSTNTIQILMTREAGLEYLKNAVQEVQDKIIRKMVAAGKLAFFDGAIDYEAMLVEMAESNESVRFSKESIKVWFAEFLSDALKNAIMDKMGDLPQSQIDKLLANYLESFQILAQRNPSMDDKIKAGLLRAMDFLPADHDSITAQEIARRLTEIRPASAIMLAL